MQAFAVFEKDLILQVLKQLFPYKPVQNKDGKYLHFKIFYKNLQAFYLHNVPYSFIINTSNYPSHKLKALDPKILIINL